MPSSACTFQVGACGAADFLAQIPTEKLRARRSSGGGGEGRGDSARGGRDALALGTAELRGVENRALNLRSHVGPRIGGARTRTVSFNLERPNGVRDRAARRRAEPWGTTSAAPSVLKCRLGRKSSQARTKYRDEGEAAPPRRATPPIRLGSGSRTPMTRLSPSWSAEQPDARLAAVSSGTWRRPPAATAARAAPRSIFPKNRAATACAPPPPGPFHQNRASRNAPVRPREMLPVDLRMRRQPHAPTSSWRRPRACEAVPSHPSTGPPGPPAWCTRLRRKRSPASHRAPLTALAGAGADLGASWRRATSREAPWPKPRPRAASCRPARRSRRRRPHRGPRASRSPPRPWRCSKSWGGPSRPPSPQFAGRERLSSRARSVSQKRSAWSVSSACVSSGLAVTTTVMRAAPPSAGASSVVSRTRS